MGARGVEIGAGANGNRLPDLDPEARLDRRDALGRLIPMQLDAGEPRPLDGVSEQGVVGIDEHADAADMARRLQLASAARLDVARALGEEDEADMARAAANGGIDGLGRGEPADLGAGRHGRGYRAGGSPRPPFPSFGRKSGSTDARRGERWGANGSRIKAGMTRGQDDERCCARAFYSSAGSKRSVPRRITPPSVSFGCREPSNTTTSAKSNGLTPSRQAALMPYWLGFDRR